MFEWQPFNTSHELWEPLDLNLTAKKGKQPKSNTVEPAPLYFELEIELSLRGVENRVTTWVPFYCVGV